MPTPKTSKSELWLKIAILTMLLFLGVSSVSAVDGSITKTLRYGMKDTQVKYLQQFLNEKGYIVSRIGAGSVGLETTYFGKATDTAVKAYQRAKGLVADGIFGTKSRASLSGIMTYYPTPVVTNYPAGCISNSGYSAFTGLACNRSTITTYPTGCSSTLGFSAVTGRKCDGTVQTTTFTTSSGSKKSGGGGGGGGSTPTPTPAPTISISTNSTSVSYNNSATLTWSATNATSCTANGAWSGTKATSGTESTGSLTSTKIYTLTCSGVGGSTSNSAAVTVETQPVMSGTLTSSAPSCTIVSGSSSCNVNFTWTTTNPQAVSTVTKPTNVNVANGNTGTNVSFAVKYNSETFYLYNNSQLLAQSTITANCVSGTVWNGSICALSQNISPTVSITSPASNVTSFSLNSTLNFSGTISDPDSSSLVVSWYIDRMGDNIESALIKESTQTPGVSSGSITMSGTKINTDTQNISLQDVGATYNLTIKVFDSVNVIETTRSFVLVGVTATCSDGIKNQNEVDTDCGGNCAACAAGGKISIYPNNPRYFQSASGTPMFLLGYYNWACVHPDGTIDHFEPYGYMTSTYANMIQKSQDYGLNYIRISLGINKINTCRAAFAYVSGKADLDQWDTVYWNGFKYYLDLAKQKGLIVHITIFDAVDFRGGSEDYRWVNSYWNVDNQKQSYYGDLDINNNGYADQAGEFYRVSDFNNNVGVGKYQRKFIDKVIQETGNYDNVFYEIGNELLGSTTEWNYAVASYIKSKTDIPITENSCDKKSGCLAKASSTDGLTKHTPDTMSEVKTSVGELSGLGYPFMQDPDGSGIMAASSNDLRAAAWYSFTGGAFGWGGFTEDFWINNVRTDVLRYYGNLIKFIEQTGAPFWDMFPNHNLVSNSGVNSVLSKTNNYYLVYVKSDSQITLNLAQASGTFTVKLYNPATGVFTDSSNVQGGSTITINKPLGATDWVLHLKSTANATNTPWNTFAEINKRVSSNLANALTAFWSAFGAFLVGVFGD
ncbi:MAG: hypothetical protein UR62_C0012G0039 [Candidatus Nomurabacteria bacterium GW2011_GWF2_35_12]|uniref:Peptidoglycan binding-like domain-containing protein n=2 Tax=Candidatus Nomuraibacteriota TaxID=1752729 RepID=A0A0G0GFF8_9BACT|nr:MAG: hypothetical protein UR62_C0012G0039 [Candidatus Nomurabacteria bacterium GW2011_GWF2_35_12]KKP76358.1 MAG: hypothetical protein UR72_C0002G0004 [Parcubacteria group bacterium GW2011_GWC1_35_21]KKP84774.1 MAG: hypothetical protein UR86_C0021G0004 [Parcubacteria group bacterium GW2011_GWD2_35_7]KKP98570.1 MAG: hypothetical protein US05_C0002G0017 [Candidatus Nomurabacteria bacterium GW2011_GWA1_36_15]HCY17918.1 hypothetical protein [Candidatus Nomurabacteria bacterium]